MSSLTLSLFLSLSNNFTLEIFHFDWKYVHSHACSKFAIYYPTLRINLMLNLTLLNVLTTSISKVTPLLVPLEF